MAWMKSYNHSLYEMNMENEDWDLIQKQWGM